MLRAALAFVIVSPVLASDVPKITPSQRDFFEKKIRPMLVRHCYECHSSKAKELSANLSLEFRDAILKGGDNGPAVVPGKPEKSLLIKAILYPEDDTQMPPKGKLPAAIIEDFKKWVASGLPDPRTGKAKVAQRVIDIEQGRKFWSFQPLAAARVPKIKDTAWPRSSIDRYLLARMEKNFLSPTIDADRTTLARRAYFDLWGLPPTREQIHQFLADEQPGAWGRLIDRLLASPRFGERWGRHWLDVARFAESSGGGRTLIFPQAWRYRDYVIRSFNINKPFDQFAKEQIAGDLLNPRKRTPDEIVGLGFLVLGPTNYENQNKEQLRMDVIDEQIDTMSRAFLGMTVGCARCHDHKFDPIPTRDYYAMAGIFRSTKTLTPGNVSGYEMRTLPGYEDVAARFDAHQKELKVAQAELAKLTKKGKGGLQVAVSSKSLPGVVVDATKAKLTGQWSSSANLKPHVDTGYHYTKAGNGSKAVFTIPVKAGGEYEVRFSYTSHPNRARKVPIVITHAAGSKTVTINEKKKPEINGLFASLGKFKFTGKAVVVVDAKTAAGGTVCIDAVQLLTPEQAAKTARKLPTKPPRPQPGAEKKAPRIAELQKKIKNLSKSTPPKAPLVMAVKEESQPGDYHLLIRGNLKNKGKVVPRGFLQVASRGAIKLQNKQSGRRELAEWVASPSNPLTARVAANRIWGHLMGRGIVGTPDNFGAMGDRPTHPQLLDYLAKRLIENEWSIKSLIRQIMMSRAYQMDSEAPPDRLALDPQNQWLSWKPKKRLEAEAIRDSVLAVSGDLNPVIGGGNIPAKLKSEFAFNFAPYRERSVYLPVFRNTLPDIFKVFDFADPNIVVGRRPVSTLPTQALFLMNSPWVISQSQKSADRLLAETKSLSQTDRIARAFETSLGRAPTNVELELTQEHLAKIKDRRMAWASVFQTLFSSLDFRYVR